MYEIHTAETPNPNAYKFMIATELLFEDNYQYQRTDFPEESVFLSQIFKHPGIRQIYCADRFFTVTKEPDADWFEIAGYVRKTIIYYLTPEAIAFLTEGEIAKKHKIQSPNSDNPNLNEWFSSKILPATEQDGGGMFLRRTTDDTVIVEPVGACVGCPYIDQTLEQGILEPLKNISSSLTKIEWKV